MHHIRRFRIFTLLEGSPEERIVRTSLPRRRGTGGVSLLELHLIVAAARIVNARRVLTRVSSSFASKTGPPRVSDFRRG
jgi:hypothetical protein